jgi:hypothetical protein
MPDWIQNPQAVYVLAAYAVAGVALLGILLISLVGLRRVTRKFGLLRKSPTKDVG